jgi:hypothetical protein
MSTTGPPAGTVGSQLVDGGVLRPRVPGPAVTALVPEDQPGLGREVLPLVVPHVLIQAVAVAEHQGDGRVLEPADLGVQGHSVIGDDGYLAAAQLTEWLGGSRIWLHPHPADGHLLDGDDRADAGRGDPGSQSGDASKPPPPGHQFSRPRHGHDRPRRQLLPSRFLAPYR